MGSGSDAKHLARVMSAAVLPEMTAEGADRLRGRISVRLDAIADNYAGDASPIREALNRNIYLTLGHASHAALVKGPVR
jgi:hypothetical protein